MAYTQLAEVEGLLRGPELTNASTPSRTDAESMVEDIGAEIDAALVSHGVTVPVTTPLGFARWLAKVNREGAAASILTARFADDKGVNANAAAARYEKRYQEALARLWVGDIIPTAATGGARLPTSFSVEYPNEEPTLGDIQAPAFGHAWAL